MRYLKTALAALVGGVLLTAAVLAVEMIHAKRVTASQMADCESTAAAGAGGICFGYAQFGGNELPAAFVIGFAATFIWFRRRQRRLVA